MENTTLVGVAWLMKAKELYNIQQQRRALEKREAELGIELRTLSNNQPMSFGGMRYYFEIRSGYVDYNAIPELKNIDLNKYRKPNVITWKLAIDAIN